MEKIIQAFFVQEKIIFMQDKTQNINIGLQEKINKLAEEKFREEACFDFFGSLNILEVERLIELFSSNNETNMPQNTKEFLLKYLERLYSELKNKQ